MEKPDGADSPKPDGSGKPSGTGKPDGDKPSTGNPNGKIQLPNLFIYRKI